MLIKSLFFEFFTFNGTFILRLTEILKIVILKIFTNYTRIVKRMVLEIKETSCSWKKSSCFIYYFFTIKFTVVKMKLKSKTGSRELR